MIRYSLLNENRVNIIIITKDGASQSITFPSIYLGVEDIMNTEEICVCAFLNSEYWNDLFVDSLKRLDFEPYKHKYSSSSDCNGVYLKMDDLDRLIMFLKINDNGLELE